MPRWAGISAEAGKNLSLGPRRCGVQLLLHWELHGHDSLPLLGLQREARKGLWGLSFATAWALASRVQRVLNTSLAVPSQLVRFFRTFALPSGNGEVFGGVPPASFECHPQDPANVGFMEKRRPIMLMMRRGPPRIMRIMGALSPSTGDEPVLMLNSEGYFC